MISVIIPAYNCANTIEECVNSIIYQSRYDLIEEIIIIDDGSTDCTAKLINEKFYKNKKVKYIFKKNGGVSSARNLGIKESKCEWIALLDSDDIWKNEKISKQIDAINLHCEIEFIGAGRNLENVRIGKKITDGLYRISIKEMLFKTWPHTSTALFKKEILEKVGNYDEKRTHAEDGQLWLKILDYANIYYLSESLEIAGSNKQTFGESGLSANLEAMHQGCVLNIMECYERKQITVLWKWFFLLYENIKYLRRKVLSKK